MESFTDTNDYFTSTTESISGTRQTYRTALIYFGYLLTGLSAICRYPQITKIYNNKSGAGVSQLGITMETMSYTITCGYDYYKKFKFDTWAEFPLLMITSLIIYNQIQYYDKEWFKLILYDTQFISWLYLFATILLTDLHYRILQTSVVFLLVGGKVAQIVRNYENGHCGYLSTVMTALLWFIGFGRIFTTIERNFDILLIILFVLVTVANTVILWQIYYYRKQTAAFIETDQIKKDNGSVFSASSSQSSGSDKTLSKDKDIENTRTQAHSKTIASDKANVSQPSNKPTSPMTENDLKHKDTSNQQQQQQHE